MEILIIALILINALLVAVVAYMSSIIRALSSFRRQVMNRYSFQHRIASVVRYKANWKVPIDDIQIAELWRLYYQKQQPGEFPAIAYIHDRLIDSIVDALRNDLKKNHQLISVEIMRSGYDYLFLGEMKIAIVPTDDEEVERFRSRIATDKSIHPIISKHF